MKEILVTYINTVVDLLGMVFRKFKLFGYVFAFVIIVIFVFDYYVMSSTITSYLESVTMNYFGLSKKSTEKKIDKAAILSRWVYNHSGKISKDTCKEIVTEVLKIKNPLLVLSIMEAESSFVQSSLSSKGAVGLMQINPAVHLNSLVKLGIIKEKRDLFNIKESILSGQYVLDDCLKSSGNNVPKALHVYLGGQDVNYFNQILSNLANLYILSEAGIMEEVLVQVVEVPVKKSKK